AAVGWVARGAVMLVVTPREVILEHTNQHGPASLRATIPLPKEAVIVAPAASDPLLPLLFRPYGPRVVTVALDVEGSLFEISNDFDPPLTRFATKVTALAPLRQQIAFVGSGPLTMGPQA